MTDDDHAVLTVDTGAGKWFVLEKADTEFHLVAGPYQTENAMRRWLDKYTPAAGVEVVASVRCEGPWRDAIAHGEAAVTEWKQRTGK
jgi:hypothetical protein